MGGFYLGERGDLLCNGVVFRPLLGLACHSGICGLRLGVQHMLVRFGEANTSSFLRFVKRGEEGRWGNLPSQYPLPSLGFSDMSFTLAISTV